MVRAVLRLAALLEPRVLIRAVVHDKIHEHPQAALMRAVEHLTEHVKVAVIRVNVHIIGNVVPVIGVRRWVQGREPDRVHVQALYIIQLRQYAPQIADAVSIAVAEAARPDMIHGHLLIPRRKSHNTPPPPTRAAGRYTLYLLYILAHIKPVLNKYIYSRHFPGTEYI